MSPLHWRHLHAAQIRLVLTPLVPWKHLQHGHSAKVDGVANEQVAIIVPLLSVRVRLNGTPSATVVESPKLERMSAAHDAACCNTLEAMSLTLSSTMPPG